MAVIIYLLIALVCGFIAKSIAAERDMEGGFWWGFFLGIIGILVVVFRPNESKHYSYTPSSSSSYSSSSSSGKLHLFDSNQNNNSTGFGYWTCLCGRTNSNGTGICSCGRTKAEVLAAQYREKEEQKNELIIKEEQKEEEKVKNKIAEDNLKLDALKKLKELLDMGAISQEEYDEKKKIYLA